MPGEGVLINRGLSNLLWADQIRSEGGGVAGWPEQWQPWRRHGRSKVELAGVRQISDLGHQTRI